MNYQAHYDRLIEKYGTWEKPKDVYTERHRKLPGYLGGKYVKGNAFYMSARAHYIAHILWAKITNHGSAWCAVKQIGAELKRVNSRIYQSAKIIHSEHMRVLFTGDSNPAKRPDIKLKMSAAQKANPVWLGKSRPEHSARMAGERNPAYGKSEHAQGLVKYGKSIAGKTLEEIHGVSKGSELRASMKLARKHLNPVWVLKNYVCHVCLKNIRGCGNVSQHLSKTHGLNYAEFKTHYQGE